MSKWRLGYIAGERIGGDSGYWVGYIATTRLFLGMSPTLAALDVGGGLKIFV